MNSQSPRQPFKRSEAGAKGGAPKGNQNAKKNNQKQAKQAKVDLVELKQAKQAKQADKEEDKKENINLLPNGNKKESKKESGSFDANACERIFLNAKNAKEDEDDKEDKKEISPNGDIKKKAAEPQSPSPEKESAEQRCKSDYRIYGEFKKVKLLETEYSKLAERMGKSSCEDYIARFGETDCPQCAFKRILRGHKGVFICFLEKNLPKTESVLKRL